MAQERSGFIGTGIMGKLMALNLQEAGYSLIVDSRTKSKARELRDRGVKWVGSPADVTKGSDVVITCFIDTPDFKEVLLDQNGVIETASRVLICVDMSTMSPPAISLCKRGGRLLETT